MSPERRFNILSLGKFYKIAFPEKNHSLNNSFKYCPGQRTKILFSKLPLHHLFFPMIKNFSGFVCALFMFSMAVSAQPKYEFRGVWIATVSNIDFPSSKTMNSWEQKAEFVKILDMHQRNGMNAIVMQIRPASTD